MNIRRERLYYSSEAYGRCKCGRILTKEMFERSNMCPDCERHKFNGTDTIEKYNEWLRSTRSNV